MAYETASDLAKRNKRHRKANERAGCSLLFKVIRAYSLAELKGLQTVLLTDTARCFTGPAMTESNLSNSDVNAQPPQTPAVSLSNTAMGSSEVNGLPERLMTMNEETESNSNPESRGLVQDPQAVKGGGNVPPEKPPPRVLYKVLYFNEDMKVIFSKEDNEPMAVQSSLSVLKQAVIEVITDVRIFGSYTSSDAEKEEPRTAISILGTKLKINSPAIVLALQSVIEYYPQQSFSDDANTIWEPYAALIHHEEELKAYRDHFDPNAINSQEELCQRNVNAYEHLGILQDVLFERSGEAVKAERQRHARGVATFEMLWLLYKPGTDVYCDGDADDNYSAYVVKSVSGGMFRGRSAPLSIVLWRMDYDGNKVGRCIEPFTLPVYDGEKEITSLIVVPCEYWKENSKEGEETKTLRQKLEERGKTFFKLAQRQCMNYSGTTHSWPKKQVSIS